MAFGLLFLQVALAAALPPADATASAGMVAQISLDGPIGPAAAEYFVDASKRATADGARAIVLRVDTPGGLSESMRQIISSMLACRLPVLVYVAPAGARAASAGTYILYAGQIAAMAPATHLGAATPVSLGGRTPMPLPKASSKPAPATSSAADEASSSHGNAETEKGVNDAIAYIRSLAQLRGRNAAWAERAVRGAATLTADEAVQQHVVDFVAADVADLLAKADGRTVQVGGTASPWSSAVHPCVTTRPVHARDSWPSSPIRPLPICCCWAASSAWCWRRLIPA
ncbi:MAG: hypothetical protein WC617_04915 [Rhodanobacter sp.]|jgi:membrane-bound serine protease (ClpP class)